MKKVKQSKKRWARTEAQGRKDNYCISWSYRRRRIPKWYMDTFRTANETIIKRAMHDIRSGVDPEDVFIKTRFHTKSSAAWWWL